MEQPQPQQPPPREALPTPQGPHTRFDLELEFVTLLTSPGYVNWLAQNKYLQRPEMVEYLRYLRYWTEEPYVQYLTHPGPTLRVLELLQQEDFRRDILRPDVQQRLAEELLEGAASKGD